jgi:hypothetical protein
MQTKPIINLHKQKNIIIDLKVNPPNKKKDKLTFKNKQKIIFRKK